MPVYKQRKDWFFTALDSLCQQTYENKEIIVSGIVGDEALEWAKSFDGVRIVDSNIPDPKRQINEGIKFAMGEAVIQAASDDFMYRKTLAKMVKVYEDNNAVLVYPDTEYCDENLNMAYTHRAPKQFSMEALRKRQIMSDCSLVSKRVLWEFGHFDIELSKFAVWDMWLKIGQKYPDKIIHSGCVGWKYRRHDGALGRTGYGEEYRDKFYEKWGIDFRYRNLPVSIPGILING
jgi:glycosyltransferase involved in cell wall biosynthesis